VEDEKSGRGVFKTMWGRRQSLLASPGTVSARRAEWAATAGTVLSPRSPS